MTKDMQNFNKLSETRQIEIAEAIIKTLPIEKQASVRKELFG